MVFLAEHKESPDVVMSYEISPAGFLANESIRFLFGAGATTKARRLVENAGALTPEDFDVPAEHAGELRFWDVPF